MKEGIARVSALTRRSCTRISFEDHGLEPNSLVETETLLTCNGRFERRPGHRLL